MFPCPAILSAQQELNLIRLRFYWIFFICFLFMASGTGFLLVLSSFSLKYISLSTDWIAGPNDGVAEDCFG